MTLFHLRPHSHDTFSFETTFIWFTVNPIFMIYIPFLCGRSEILKVTIHLKLNVVSDE